ncbi:hypothetical protein LY78DRAFT_76502 [Colletotrichum sublineola]|nr:hypothetical protein LY78DRAFT_76502 [Colletotrichum sublineola]
MLCVRALKQVRAVCVCLCVSVSPLHSAKSSSVLPQGHLPASRCLAEWRRSPYLASVARLVHNPMLGGYFPPLLCSFHSFQTSFVLFLFWFYVFHFFIPSFLPFISSRF